MPFPFSVPRTRRPFFGKLVGTLMGFFIAGPTGALIGFILGHLRDLSPLIAAPVDSRRDAEARENGFSDRFEQSTYTMGVIVLSAKMAKSDGRVSRAEISAFRRVFSIDEAKVDEVGRVFDQARLTSEGFEPYAARLAQVFRYRKGVLEEILTGLFFIALADSRALSRAEDVFLRRVAGIFGFTENDYVRIAARAGVSFEAEEPTPKKSEEDEAYAVMGLPKTVTDWEVKKTYHALLRKHHPDRLIAQGLPQELIAQATEKMKRINVAYATISKARGMK